MSVKAELPPLSLYIHIPWCERKCPYCDFNSHENFQPEQEALYAKRLIEDLKHDLETFEINRPLHSIFIGGGTPSIFSVDTIDFLLNEISKLISFETGIEITMEANPASSQDDYFSSLSNTPVNRVSLGVQSFQEDKLKVLGRLHDKKQALNSLEQIKKYFNNFNLDLMFGLPNQDIESGLSDLQEAMIFEPVHLSWYQLTIEPNTVFYKQPPKLPQQDLIFDLQTEGIAYLNSHGLSNYEISAYGKSDFESRHNLNYWEFGDYLGIGAGAHGKISEKKNNENGLNILRYHKTRLPRDYLSKTLIAQQSIVPESELPLEFLMNFLRLKKPLPLSSFQARTGLDAKILSPFIDTAAKQGLITSAHNQLVKTQLGELHLDSLLSLI